MRISNTNRPLIFVTMGDPSGIGPEVIMRSMASPDTAGLAIFVVIGDADVMSRASEGVFDGRVRVLRHEEEEQVSLDENAVNIIDPGHSLGSLKPGEPTADGARKALACLDKAVQLMRDPSNASPKALVTAPVSKENIAGVSPGFIGHTEYLQEAYSAGLVTMVMVGEKLRVVPVTRHIPLKDVADALTEGLIADTLAQVIENRVLITGKGDARIGVCALNPHCGEGGKIGREESEVIGPAVERARKSYEAVIGPVSADVAFYNAFKGKLDIVVSMYHDQCLSPFKMIEFDRGVNMTLGLGQVRTSPDHGTAFDIAGKGIADPGSMISAVKLAARAVKRE